MSDELNTYIRQAKDSGDDHQAIHSRLVGAGWHPDKVQEALDNHTPWQPDGVPVDTGAGKPAFPATPAPASSQPIGVVKVFSTRGVEYYFMLTTLAVSAGALGTLLLSIAGILLGDGPSSVFDATGVMAFTTASLIVAFPIFAFLFLRLKKAELLHPQLRLDQSRRRMVQIALIVSFLASLFSTISYLFVLVAAAFGDSTYAVADVGLTITDFAITITIAGGIFTYFWLDSHRKGEQ